MEKKENKYQRQFKCDKGSSTKMRTRMEECFKNEPACCVDCCIRKRGTGECAKAKTDKNGKTIKGEHAHHIGPHGEFSRWVEKAALINLDIIQKALNQLDKTKGGVDSCVNGVCVSADIHSGLHTKEYINKVAARLQDFTDPDLIRAELQKIKNEICNKDKEWKIKKPEKKKTK